MSSKRGREEKDERLATDEILSIVKEIVHLDSSIPDKKKYIQRKYPLFAEHYPMLLELSLQEDFDMKRLEYMLKLKDAVENENMSQHDASVHVGQHLYDKYVKDKISHKPPPSS